MCITCEGIKCSFVEPSEAGPGEGVECPLVEAGEAGAALKIF